MSGNFFTPIPSAAAGGGASGFRNMPQFRSALPVASGEVSERWFQPLVLLPSVPAASDYASPQAPVSWHKPFADLPVQHGAGFQEQPVFMPEIVLPPETPAAGQAPPSAQEEAVECPFKAVPDFSDEELTQAFAPIVQAAVRRAIYESDGSKIDALLEPMLRATVRRALAEYSPASRPFQPPGFMDRTVWRLQALFSSRSYEDVLFEKTHRFQVDEVFLFDVETLALISFASCDPARHSTAKRVEGAAHRIALQIRDEAGAIRQSFEQPDGRNVIAELGQHVLLVAVVKGRPNELILADLAFSLHRIEDHFRERFEQAGSALMHALQPFLEDCLLIQAPASAA